MQKQKPFVIPILTLIFLVTTAAVAVANKPLAGVKVVVDAGHGGWDPGAVGVNGLTEKQVNLQVAKALRNCLVEYGGAEVIMTRTDDSSVLGCSCTESQRQLGGPFHLHSP